MRRLFYFIAGLSVIGAGIRFFISPEFQNSQAITYEKQEKFSELLVVKPELQGPHKPIIAPIKNQVTHSVPKTGIPEESEGDVMKEELRRKIEEEREGIPKRTRADLAMEQEWEMTHDPKTGEIPRERLYAAYKYMKEVEARNATEKTTAAIPNIIWEERGPTNQGGRTRALMLDPNDPTHRAVFAGSVSGGIWKTNDIFASNPNWQSLDDFMANLAVTTIAYDPTDPQIMYAGTGEGWFNGDAVRGAGIFKSIDGGNLWTQLTSTNITDFHYVQKIVVTPTGTVLAATRSSVTGEGGIYRSTDKGLSWSRVYPSTGGSRATDLEVAANGDIYAAVGMWYSDGIYRSTDDGLTWTQVYNSGANERRIELACAPSNPNVVYAMIENNTQIGDIIKTTNRGGAWSSVVGGLPTWSDCGTNNGTDFSRGQAWYDLILAVDPLDENTVWAGGVDLMRTTDGGNTWEQMTSWCGAIYPEVHADHHALFYFPGQSDTLLFGNDGGVYVSTDASAANPTYIVKNNNYRTLQLYSCALHPDAGSNYALGGAQDNGSHQWTTAGLGPTTEVSGGDGAFAHIDQADPTFQFTAYVYNNYFRSINGGITFSSVPGAPGNIGRFINPSDYDNNAAKLYAAGNSGTYIRWDNPRTGSTFTAVNAGFAGTVTAVTVDDNIPNRVWFGSYDPNNGNPIGGVYVVDNAHTNTPIVTNVSTGLPTAYVSCIAIDPTNSNHVLVTFSNYGVNSVWETTDGGANWTNVEGNLPDMPVRWALFNPNNTNQALLATELGVWSTDNLNGNLTDWQPSNVGMANVRTDMLQIRTSDKLVIAATHGRGLFETRRFMDNFAEFASISTSVNERDAATFFPATDPKNCMKYIDVDIPIKINRPPDADATISIAVNTAASTAVANKDFELLTPTITIPATTTDLLHYATVRIYDDPFLENYFTPETIVLDMTVTNSTTSNLQDGTQLQHTLYITSDDYEPALAQLNSSLQIGTGNTDSEFFSPFRGNYEDERMQLLITATELSGAGVSAGAALTSMALNVLTKNSVGAFQGFTIKIAHTTLTTLPTNFTAATFTVCYSGDYKTTPGWNYINFNQNFFVWDGTSNLLVELCYDNPNGNPPGGADLVEVTDFTDGNNYIAYTRRNGDAGCSMTFNNGVDSWAAASRPNVIFNFRTPVAIQTATNPTSADSLYVLANETVHFYDASGKIIATLANANFDPGCTKVYVERQGTTAQPFWYNNPPNYLADKTYLVNVANNNPAGQYNIQFYYTQAEVNGWITATAAGYTWADADIVKIPGPISGVSPSNPYPYGTGNEIITAPTTGTYEADFTIAGNFTTGFSGFGVGVPGTPPPLAVSFLEFTGKYVNNYNKIQWRTGTESNVQTFVLERKVEGEDRFTPISETNARGGVGFGTDYSYNDFQVKPATKYYYRLKSVETNGNIQYSNVIEIFTGERNAFAQIFPVPATEKLYLRTFLPQEDNILLEVYDLKGNKAAQQTWKSLSEGNHTLEINISELAKGNYLLKIHLKESGITEIQKAILK